MGALAVALGIGSALLGGAGVAFADSTGSPAAQSSADGGAAAGAGPSVTRAERRAAAKGDDAESPTTGKKRFRSAAGPGVADRTARAGHRLRRDDDTAGAADSATGEAVSDTVRATRVPRRLAASAAPAPDTSVVTPASQSVPARPRVVRVLETLTRDLSARPQPATPAQTALLSLLVAWTSRVSGQAEPTAALRSTTSTAPTALATVAVTPTFVQVAAATPQTPQTSVAVKYSGAQTAGDTNVVAIGWNNATSTIRSVTDSAGNTYRAAVPTARGSGISQAIYYASGISSAAAGSNTVTVVFNTATPYVDLRALEYRGLDPVDPFDVGASGKGWGRSASSGTVRTTAGNELVFGAGITTGGFTAAGSGFSSRIITTPDGDIAQDKAVSTAGRYSATASLRGYSRWLMQVATFRAASAPAAVPDTTAPTVSVSVPAGTVSGTVTFTATATDNVGVAGVQFLVDNAAVGAADPSSPYSVSWNSAGAANGAHTVTARATDTSGNTALSAPIVFTVGNTAVDSLAPTVSVTVPGGTVSGTVTLTATASDNVAVAGVQFLVDNKVIGSQDNSSPYSVSWNSAGVSNGTHTLTARAIDTSGNTAVSAPVTVTVANTAVAPPIFVGDYSTGNFSQWSVVQNKYFNSYGKDYVPQYPATIVNDPVKGKVARFEVRSGDYPGFVSGDRSEVQSTTALSGGATEGQTSWYSLSTKFDAGFPQNHANLGWGLVNQWHASDAGGSPPLAFIVNGQNGYLSLMAERQSAPAQYLGKVILWQTPLNVGTWHDITMEVTWSASDTIGSVRLWENGVAQTLTNGSTTYHVRTLVPGGGGVYYKEGYYRQRDLAPTGIVYHAGFRVASTQAGLGL
ncbi:heparin lyase I family protein [Mycolicibacterium chubuense]|uniref:heparin lyase I family protein n=1 Tax=Mycolicibacterium chubuense TaxID=1800 RepID=UPI0012FEAE37|nr:heparin lyase I family protein [Mycolicibacterium chubuense]